MQKTSKHTTTLPNGNKIDIEKLYDIVNARQPTNTNIDKFKFPTTKKNGFSAERLENADTSFPIMVDTTGHLVDGRHRVTKLRQEGKTNALAHILSKEDLDSVIVDKKASLYSVYKLAISKTIQSYGV